MEKTIDIVIEELKTDIVNVVNNSNVPPYLTTMILKELLAECKAVSDIQLKQNTEKYNASQKTQKENEEK